MDIKEQEQGRLAKNLKKFSVVRFAEGPWKDHRRCVLSEWISAVEPTADMELQTLVGLRVAVHYPDEFEQAEITESRIKNLQAHDSRWNTYQGIVIQESNNYDSAKILSQCTMKSKQMKTAGVSVSSTHNLPTAVPNQQTNSSKSAYRLRFDRKHNHYRNVNNTSPNQQSRNEPGEYISLTSSHRAYDMMQRVIPQCNRNGCNEENTTEKPCTTTSKPLNVKVSHTNLTSLNKSEEINEKTQSTMNVPSIDHDHNKMQSSGINNNCRRQSLDKPISSHKICTKNPPAQSQTKSKNQKSSSVCIDSKHETKDHNNTSDIKQNRNSINKYVHPEASSTPYTKLKPPYEEKQYRRKINRLNSSITKIKNNHKGTKTYNDLKQNNTLSVKFNSTNISSQMSKHKSTTENVQTVLAPKITPSRADISQNNLDLTLRKTDTDKIDSYTKHNSTSKSKAMNITTPSTSTPERDMYRNKRLKSVINDSCQDTSRKTLEVITKDTLTTCIEANKGLTKDTKITDHDTQLLNELQIILEAPAPKTLVDSICIRVTPQNDKDSKETEQNVPSINNSGTCSKISIHDNSMCTEVISATEQDTNKAHQDTQSLNNSQVISKSPVQNVPVSFKCIEVPAETTKKLKKTEQNTNSTNYTQDCPNSSKQYILNNNSMRTEVITETVKASNKIQQDGQIGQSLNSLVQIKPVDTTCTNVQDNIIPIVNANSTLKFVQHLPTNCVSLIRNNNHSSPKNDTNNGNDLVSQSGKKITLENEQELNEVLCRLIGTNNIQDERAVILQNIFKNKPDNIRINETHFITKENGDKESASSFAKELKYIVEHNNNLENCKCSLNISALKRCSTGDRNEENINTNNIAERKRKYSKTEETDCDERIKTDNNNQLTKRKRRKRLLFNPYNPIGHLAITFQKVSDTLLMYLKQQKPT